MKKILLVILAVGLMLGYVWMRSINNRLTERVTELERQAEILQAKLERERTSLDRKLIVTDLEPRAKALGLYYPWEENGQN
jgi:uncharacterized membrane-anchored protein YhcB (DUF1043 family)